MFEWFRQRVLAFMRVPPAPEPPSGAPESVRIFRAGRNYYRLRLFGWLATQVGAVIGLLFSVSFLYWFKSEVQAAHLPPAQAVAVEPPLPVMFFPGFSTEPPAKSQARVKRQRQFTRQELRSLARRTPEWALVIIEVIEFGGIMLFLLQLPITFAAVRLEFELHWYIVTDRSLRIRTGLMRLQESTMSFANLQQVEIQQGPLQRLLGLADLRVQSAGGGADRHSKHTRDSLHTGIFHGVENATEIRDLILERLRRFRESGIGDPDDHAPHDEAPKPAMVSTGDALAAAREVLAEVRALKRAL